MELIRNFRDGICSDGSMCSYIMNTIIIVGFGNFSVSHRKATTGRNPRTGESIQIPASKRPKFTVGKALKDSVNN